MCLLDEALDLDACGTGYFQVHIVMKPEGFLGPLLLNSLGDLPWENTNFAKVVPQRKHCECSLHCIVIDVCSNDFQDPVVIITGTRPHFFFPSEESFVQERNQG